ncbi:RlpA-like double-psi beta-barrel-protein domain-containing protein-containing protein [Dactylonectria macrodidyma]|uniref:Cellulase n=1 Tax=Dactylonectria macrodidyma TaxID=307937 RepID=A0A9P9DLV3_9HYPO|nr:RlpA-like double-psi beta-barrel-protein domain-containing protein-containing protein [Dactylonectria macrodidyma]
MRSSTLYFALAGPIAVRAASGTGQSTRYWDCCKPSCAWNDKAAVSAPALTCDANDNPISDANAVSGCDGGTSYTCSNYSPWAVSDTVAYGFAATALDGGSESTWCCACYALTFTSGSVKGKTMVVQSTNTGSDLGSNHFDLLMPGGGVGIFDGCTSEFGTALAGAQYGGISSQSQCDSFPEILQDGCNWRFDWFGNSDNPGLTFEQVQCPTEITDISGCIRDDDGDYPVFSGAGSSSGSSTSSAVAAASSAKTSSTSSSIKASSTAIVKSEVPSSSSEAEAVGETKASSAQWSKTTVAQTTKTTAQAESHAAQETEASIQTEAPATQTKAATTKKTKAKTRSKAGGCSAKSYTATLAAAGTAVSAASASTSTVAIYQQCNGASDLFPNGALACAEGSTCVYSNDWYSQCQPN